MIFINNSSDTTDYGSEDSMNELNDSNRHLHDKLNAVLKIDDVEFNSGDRAGESRPEGMCC